METAAENRLSVAMRLPKHEVQIVNAYAKENGLTKTDAFLHFLRQGIASENERADSDRLCSIEQLLQEILHKVDAPAAAPSIADVRQCVAAEAAKFPAIEKAILFGSMPAAMQARKATLTFAWYSTGRSSSVCTTWRACRKP
ncbi:MAG: hypothetical protein V8T51_00615 [Senegalimassilia faecalis]